MKPSAKVSAVWAAFFLLVACGTVCAEQPAADEYRQMFRAGNFCIEFKDKWGERVLAGFKGMRMERTSYRFSESNAAWLNPLGKIFDGSGPQNPETLFKDGKYYQFVERDQAIMCDETELFGENLDPRQGWDTIAQKLALPDELAVFYWTDSFRKANEAVAAPQYVESFKKKHGAKEYDCDRYMGAIRTVAGDQDTKIVYDMLYDEGKLVWGESFIMRGETIYPVNTLEIYSMLGKQPTEAFKLAKKTKVYAAGTGDMSDLLEKPLQIGTMGEL